MLDHAVVTLAGLLVACVLTPQDDNILLDNTPSLGDNTRHPNSKFHHPANRACLDNTESQEGNRHCGVLEDTSWTAGCATFLSRRTTVRE